MILTFLSVQIYRLLKDKDYWGMGLIIPYCLETITYFLMIIIWIWGMI